MIDADTKENNLSVYFTYSIFFQYFYLPVDFMLINEGIGCCKHL